MTPQDQTPSKAAEEKPKADEESTGKPATEEKAKAEPKVETVPSFEPGDKVQHAGKRDYIVRYQTKEGVALEGVANLIEPKQLKLLQRAKKSGGK